MPRIQKKSPLQRLSTFQTLVVDTNTNSTYFKLSEIPDQLTAGKNAFLIEGTPYLRRTTDIKIEVLDVDGNPLFVEPGEGIPEYYEGLSKLISIHVYADTPIGIGKITILGELERYIDETGLEKDVPDIWQGVYNVKWEKEIKINKNVSNETRVRFLQRPSIIIDETGESFYSRNVTSSLQTTGTVRGLAVTPIEGTDMSTWRGGIQYLIQNESTDFVDNGKTITIANTSIQNADVLEYITQRSLLVQVPNTSSQNILTNFTSSTYTLEYEYVSSVAQSDLFGSFARFEINNLKTFVGDVERLKVYAKSRSTSADYALLHDTKIDSANLLTTVISGSTENLGYFTSSYTNGKPYTYYWTTQSSVNISLDSLNLYKSVKFQNNKVSSNLGTSIRLEKDSEYTLEFYTYYSGSVVNENDTLKVYLTSTQRGGGVTSYYILTSSIVELYGNSIYKTPQKLSYNFIPDSTDYWQINFESTNPNSDTYWQIGSVTLEGSNELGYSPDEYTFTVPIIRQIEQDTYDFRFEWFDINNNFVPIVNTGTQTFVSGNLTLLGKNLSVDADKLFFTFNGDSAADPTNQSISLLANKTKLVGNLLITSQAFDSGGAYIPPASFLGTPYPGKLINTYENTSLFSGSLTISNFTGSLHGTPPSPGNVIVDRILYTFTEANSTQPLSRRLSVSRVLSSTGSAGAAGANAKSVDLVSNVYAIPYDGNNVEIGTNNIWLTASQQNHVGTVYYEFLKNDVSKQNTTSQYYNVLTADKPTSGSRDSWKVNTREGSSGGTIVTFDTIDLFGLKAGDNGYTVFLTNNSTTFPATETGVVDSTVLSSGITDVVFYKGTASFTYDQTFPYDTNSYRTGSIVSSSGITVSTSVVNNNLRITPTAINTNSGTNLSGSLTIPIVENSTSLNFILSYRYSIAKAGTSGSNALSIVLNPPTQIVSKSIAGTYKSPVTFSIQVFETGSALLYTGSNNTLQNGYFTIFAGTSTSMGTLIPATGSLSASIIPPNVTSDAGTTSSFAVRYRDSRGNLSTFISQSHLVNVVTDGLPGASGSDARTVLLSADRYAFTYNGDGVRTPTAQTSSLTASAQTGSAANPWGANIFYEFIKNGTTRQNTSSPYYIITGSEIPSAGGRDLWQVNLKSGSGQTLVAFDTLDIFGVKEGTAAKTVTLNSPYYVISYDANGNRLDPNVSSFLVTASALNFTSPYFKFTGDVTTPDSSYTAGSSSNEDTSSFTVPSTFFTGPKNIRVGVAESSAPTTEIAYDTITIVGVKPGQTGSNALPTTFYYIKPLTGTAIKNSTGTLEIQAVLVSGSETIDLQSGSVVLASGSTAGSKLQVGNGVTAGLTYGVTFNAKFDATGISGSRVIYLKDTGSNKIWDTITLVDATDGLGVGSAFTETLLFRRDPYTNQFTPTTSSITASFYSATGTQYTESYRVYPFYEGGLDKMYYTLDQDNPYITASVDDGSGIKVSPGFSQRVTTKDLNFTFRFFDPQINDTGSFVETFYIISDGQDGDDAYTVVLSNETTAIQSQVDGIVPVGNYAGSGTQIIVYRGTTELNGITSGTPVAGQFSASFVTVTGSITVGSITSPGNPIVVGNHSNFTSDSASITYIINCEGSQSISKVQTLTKAREGAAAYTVFLTNEAHVFPADQFGNVSAESLTNGISNVSFYKGTSSYTYSQVSPPPSNTYRTGSITSSFNITASYSVVNNNLRLTPIGVTGSTQLSGSIIIPIIESGSNTTFVQTYTFSISKTGLTGASGSAGASGSDARVVSLTSDRYTFTYNGDGVRTPTAQTASLTSSAQTGSGANPWGANIFYEFVKNGTTRQNTSSPYYIITGSEIPSAGNRDLWQVNLRSGSGQTLVAFDTVDIFGVKEGTAAKTVTLNSPYYAITYDANGNRLDPNVSSFLVTASALNFTSPYFKFTGDVTTPDASYTAGSSSNEDTSSFSVPSTYFTTPKNIRVGVAESSAPSTEIAYDTITIIGVKPGQTGSNALPTIFYYIRPLSGSAIKNSTGTLEIQAVLVSGSEAIDLQSGSVVLSSGSTAGSKLQVGNGVTAGSTYGVTFNAKFDATGISGSRIVYLKDTGSNKIWDTITLVDATDGLGGGSAFTETLLFRRDPYTNQFTPATSSLTASFFSANGTQYTESYRVYPFYESGLDKMYFTLDQDNPYITASVDDGSGLKVSPGFSQRVTTKDLNFTFRFFDPQINDTGSFVETFYIISDGQDGDDAYTVVLTNESHTIQAQTDGIVPVGNYGGSGTEIIAYRGTASLNGITSGVPVAGQFSASYTITGSITVGSITSPNNSIIVGNHSNFTSDSASITYIINLENSASISKIQNLTKARQGASGYTVFLTNEATIFPGDEGGNVAPGSLAIGISDVSFYKGTASYTYSQTTPPPANTYRTGSITSSFNITASYSVVNNNLRLTPIGVTGSTQLSGSIVIPIIESGSNTTFITTYTFGISKAGSGSNAVSVEMSPSTQTITSSLVLGTYAAPLSYSVFVYETGSTLRYTTSQPPTTRGTFTIYMGIGNNGTNVSTNNAFSGTIAPPTPNAIRPFTSSFSVQYLDSKGNLSGYISQSHIINVVTIGQTGPGIVFTGPWSSSRTYQYSEGSANGRRDAVISGSSNRYYAALQQHIAGPTNYPGYLVGETNDNAFWQYLGTEDAFVAAKIAIFKESYVQNTLNVGTTNYDAGYSSANITIAGGTQYPYISIGQSPSVGYNNNGIWIGSYNNGGTPNYRMSLTSGSTNFLTWDGSTLSIGGSITVTGGNAATQNYVLSNTASLSSSLEQRIFTDTTGKINRPPSVGATSGLYLGSTYLGYYNGSAWRTYMDDAGRFYLTGAGTNNLSWDGSTLNIAGTITVTGGNVPTTSSVSQSILESNISALDLKYTAGNIQISGRKITKIGGADTTWDSQVYSSIGYASGSYVTFKPNVNTQGFMIGLNTDPETDASYASINYAWYCSAIGTLEIYEGGSVAASLGSYSAGEELRIEYDGLNIKYYRAGSVVRTISAGIGQIFYLDSSFYSLNASTPAVSYFDFGPTTATSVNNAPKTSGTIGGVTIASDKIYIGNGTWGNVNTPFYVDSAGSMSLEDRLTWDTSRLNIKGKIDFGSAGSGINLVPFVWRYDPRDGAGISTDSYQYLSYNGSPTENAIDYATDPYGNSSLVWQCYPDGANNADGGWDGAFQRIDTSKTYKFIQYFKRYTSIGGGAGDSYLGTNAYNEPASINYGLIRRSDGTTDTNPYFHYGKPPLTDRWYLAVGYVFASGSPTSATTYGGVYDTLTGARVTFSGTGNGVDYIWSGSQTVYANHRAYLYYNTLGNSATLYQEMWGPAMYEVDGNEPDLNELLDKGKILAAGSASFSDLGSTFISANAIYSPNIAGQNGYFSDKFQVGNTNPIVIDASTSTRRIYQGTGTWGDTGTGFYLDGGGQFSLKDKLTWNGSRLYISGAISASEGSIGGWNIGRTSLVSGETNLSSSGDIVLYQPGSTTVKAIEVTNNAINQLLYSVSASTATAHAITDKQVTLINGGTRGDFILTQTSTAEHNSPSSRAVVPAGKTVRYLMIRPVVAADTSRNHNITVSGTGTVTATNVGTGTKCAVTFSIFVNNSFKSQRSRDLASQGAGTFIQNGASGYTVTYPALTLANDTYVFDFSASPITAGSSITCSSTVNYYGSVGFTASGVPNPGSTTFTVTLNTQDENYFDNIRLTAKAYDNVTQVGPNGLGTSFKYGTVLLGEAAVSASGTGGSNQQTAIFAEGDVRIFGGTLYIDGAAVSVSDRESKFLIEESDLGLNFITALQPRKYKYKTGGSSRTHYGLIADEVLGAVESLNMSSDDYAGYVKQNDGIEGLRYESFISPLIKSVQELTTEVNNLKAELNYIKCGSFADTGSVTP